MECLLGQTARRLVATRSDRSADGELRYSRDVTDRPSGDGDLAPLGLPGGSGLRRYKFPRPPKRDRFSERLEATNRNPLVIDVIRRARTVLPGDPAFGDPLSTAGPGGASAVARLSERLAGDEAGVAREIGLSALQVWQAVLERVGRGKGPRDITIVFTDLVGFSSWSLGAGDDATLALLRDVAKAIEPPIVERGGHVVKRMGDGLMAVFTSADRAVQAVVTAREHLTSVHIAGYQPEMRVGVHTGAPKEIGGDWLGVDVTIAARVMEAGGNGNTMLSANTLQALRPETLEDLGLTVKPYRRSFFAAPLNGVPEDLRIFTLKEA